VASLKEAEGDGTWFTEGPESLHVAVEPGFFSPNLDVVGWAVTEGGRRRPAGRLPRASTVDLRSSWARRRPSSS